MIKQTKSLLCEAFFFCAVLLIFDGIRLRPGLFKRRKNW